MNSPKTQNPSATRRLLSFITSPFSTKGSDESKTETGSEEEFDTMLHESRSPQLEHLDTIQESEPKDDPPISTPQIQEENNNETQQEEHTRKYDKKIGLGEVAAKKVLRTCGASEKDIDYLMGHCRQHSCRKLRKLTLDEWETFFADSMLMNHQLNYLIYTNLILFREWCSILDPKNEFTDERYNRFNQKILETFRSRKTSLETLSINSSPLMQSNSIEKENSAEEGSFRSMPAELNESWEKVNRKWKKNPQVKPKPIKEDDDESEPSYANNSFSKLMEVDDVDDEDPEHEFYNPKKEEDKDTLPHVKNEWDRFQKWESEMLDIPQLDVKDAYNTLPLEIQVKTDPTAKLKENMVDTAEKKMPKPNTTNQEPISNTKLDELVQDHLDALMDIALVAKSLKKEDTTVKSAI